MVSSYKGTVALRKANAYEAGGDGKWQVEDAEVHDWKNCTSLIRGYDYPLIGYLVHAIASTRLRTSGCRVSKSSMVK